MDQDSDIASTQRLGLRRLGFITLVLAFSLPFISLLLLRAFVYQPFYIPAMSGAPNLMAGDYVVVSKLAYRTQGPERGDIAVFHLPTNPSYDFIKRIIGLPGDRIQMISGRFSLNGQVVEREAIELEFFAGNPDLQGLRFYREKLPSGRSYVIAELGDSQMADNTDVYVVPDGHYFALGDNRDNSQDSRYLDQVGYVPRGNLVGRFAFRLWGAAGLARGARPEETPALIQ